MSQPRALQRSKTSTAKLSTSCLLSSFFILPSKVGPSACPKHQRHVGSGSPAEHPQERRGPAAVPEPPVNPGSLDGGSALCPGILEEMHILFPDPIQPFPPSHRSLHPAIPTKAGKHLSKVLELKKMKHWQWFAAGGLDTKLMQEFIGVGRRFFVFTHLLPRESHPGILAPSFQQDLSCPSETLRKRHQKGPQLSSTSKKHQIYF